jgi:type IV pilus assembly protein PilF
MLGAALVGCSSTVTTSDTALADADRKVSPNRERASIRLALAMSYFQNGQYDVALDETNRVLDIDDSFSDAYSLRGLIYNRQGEFAKAEASFRRALQLKPSDADARHNLALMYCQNNQLAQAVQEFNQALAGARARERGKTLLAMGICQARLGDRAGGEATLARALQEDPGNPMAAYNLAALQYQRGAWPEAQSSIRTLNNGEYANAESMWLGIRIARKAGDGRTMRDLTEQMRRRFASSPQYRLLERGAFDE